MPDPVTAEYVKIEANVLFEITRHVYDHFPAPAGGVLLGPDPAVVGDSSEALPVTGSFPLPQSAVQGDGSNLRSKDSQNFQTQMIAKLSTVEADTYVQGWYLSSAFGTIYEQPILDAQYSQQKRNPNAVLIVHDTALSRTSGSLILRAYRLSSKFFAVKATCGDKLTTDALVEYDMTYEDMLEEIPVRVHNSQLANLLAMVAPTTKSQFKVPNHTFVESSVDSIMDTIDDFNYEQGNYNYFQRQMVREKQKVAAWQQRRQQENSVRAAAGKPALPVDDWKSQFKLPEEPSRLENLLISAQLDENCRQIEELGALAGNDLVAARKN